MPFKLVELRINRVRINRSRPVIGKFGKNTRTALYFEIFLNFNTQDTGWTEENRKEMADVLLMKGASVSVVNKNGDTPIHFACRSDVDEQCLTMLMSVPDAEKTLTAENMSGHVPLHLGKYFKNMSK